MGFEPTTSLSQGVVLYRCAVTTVTNLVNFFNYMSISLGNSKDFFAKDFVFNFLLCT